MFDLIRESSLKKSLLVLLIPALVAVIYLAFVVRYSLDYNDGYLGALLDDTWIHVRYADHIAQGEGLSFNEGVVTPGATSPLWVLLLGAIYAVTDPGISQQAHIAVGLSALGNVLAVLAITGFGWWASRRAWVGFLAGVITAVTGRFIWMGLSGMEITTFTALCIVALWSHVADVRERRVFGWRTGILAALATLARPEGYLLAALIGLDAFALVPLRDGLRGAAWWQRVRPGWRGCVAYGLLAGSYPLASLLMSGHLLPNTFRIKSQLGREWPDLPYAFLWTPNVDHGPLLILLAGVGIGFLLWRAWTGRDHIGFAWTLWPVLFVLAVLFLGAQHFVVNNSRYVAPAIPFHALLGGVGIWALVDLLAGRIARISPADHPIPNDVGANRDSPQTNSPRLREGRQWGSTYVPAVLSLILVVMAFARGAEQGWRVANDTAQLRQMHVAAGHWLAQRTQPGDIIALNDVGAITHIADRRVLDLVGLVSPEILSAIEDEQRFTCAHDLELARVMLAERPVFVVVFPWFFPCLTDWTGALQPQHVFTIEGTTVIAGGEMVVYIPLWQNWPLQPAIPPEATGANIEFEQGITLAAYETHVTESGLQVTLWWTASARPTGDYTAFVHLIDSDSEIITQWDSRPQSGEFNTLWWHPGDIIHDVRLIPLEDSSLLENEELALRVGMYPTGGGPRLPRRFPQPDEPDYAVLPLE